jgi:hypothetical protein
MNPPVIKPPLPPELHDAPFISNLKKLGLEQCVPGGLYLEFGVGTGFSLRQIRKLLDPSIKLYGFDSFNGLPEPWRDLRVGAFSTNYRVDLPNTELVEGLFKDSLPRFLEQHPGHVSFIHIDCDIYSSTSEVLTLLKERIVHGTVILFDELFGYKGWERHEYRALMESGLKFEAIGRWDAFRAAIRVIEP